MTEKTEKKPEEAPEATLEQPAAPSAEAELLKAKEEAKEYKDKYLLLLAESENARKRLQKERQDIQRFAMRGILSELLFPLDQLDGALAYSENASPEIKQWAFGFKMILNQFKEILTQYHVHAFHAKGTHFNPELHEAIEVVETTEYPDGTIIEELRPGYRMGESTLRPAQVKVAKAPKKVTEKGQEQPQGGNNDVNEEKK
jgi:molecular chaperone GrpE